MLTIGLHIVIIVHIISSKIFIDLSNTYYYTHGVCKYVIYHLTTG